MLIGDLDTTRNRKDKVLAGFGEVQRNVLGQNDFVVAYPKACYKYY
jgi:hypothetical protein